MSTNLAITPPLHVEPVFSAPELRELSPLELQQVAGGLPNGSWRIVEPAIQAGGEQQTLLPNGSW